VHQSRPTVWSKVRNGPRRILDSRWRRRAIRRFRWRLRFASESFILRLPEGGKLRLWRDSELARLIFVEDYETAERQFVSRFLKPNDVFIDVGANIGLYSVIGGRIVGHGGLVYAFEPGGRVFARLQENLRLNEAVNVRAVSMALSDHCGVAQLTSSLDGYDAWASLGAPTAGRALARESVECIDWDSFSDRQGLAGRVALMKIDVEGWEQRVLRGARRSLSRHDAPTLVVEFTDANARAAGTTCQDLYKEVEGLGYRLFTYDLSRRILLAAPRLDYYDYTNLLATKDPNAVVTRLQSRSA